MDFHNIIVIFKHTDFFNFANGNDFQTNQGLKLPLNYTKT